MSTVIIPQQRRWLRWPRRLVYGLGALVLLLALLSLLTQSTVPELFAWLQRVFGPVFVVFYALLVGTGVYAFNQLGSVRRSFWLEVGQQAAAGIATLALTFTLLGISLGIGSLAEQTISPESIQSIIQNLTLHFSTAFMTTVVGLPTAQALRAALALKFHQLGAAA